MEIPVNYKPRPYQAELLKALDGGAKQAVLCWGRRAGKDMTCFAYAIKKMVAQRMNVFLVFPEKEQGRSAFWENVENDGFKTIEHIPKQLVRSVSNKDMRITLINGSTFQLVGAKNPDSLRGSNGKLYIFSEFVDIPSEAYDIIEPIVAINKGQIIIQSTPKIDGISGQVFKSMFEYAEKAKNEFASRVQAKEYLSDEELDSIRDKIVSVYGNDFIFRQEYLVDWGSASNGSYYADILDKMAKDGRIGRYPHDNAYPVYTAWDWGMSDFTAIVFFQYIKNQLTGDHEIRIIDCFETNSTGITEIIRFLGTKPYTYGWHFFPHDMAQREIDSTARIVKVQELGLVNSSILRREELQVGIDRVLDSLSSTTFNKSTTEQLVRKLQLYRRKFNKRTGEFIGAEHNSASHFADAFRYVYTAIEQGFDKNCNLLFGLYNQNDTYEVGLENEFYTRWF